MLAAGRSHDVPQEPFGPVESRGILVVDRYKAHQAIDDAPAALHVHALTCSSGGPTHHLDVQFVARAPRDARIAISDESLDLRWWPLDDLPQGSDFGLRQLARAATIDASPRPAIIDASPRPAQTSVE